MGWDITKKKERKKWLKERKKLAEKLSDMPLVPGKQPVWEPGWKEPLGWEPTGYQPGPTEADIAKWNRLGTRLAAKGAKAPAAPVAPAPPSFPGGWPPPEGKYQRWSSWYGPEATIPEQPYLGDINKLLPYMAPEDVATLTRQLYIGGKGAQGPFQKYLAATAYGQPPYGGAPTAPTGGGGYEQTLQTISGILAGIQEPTARAWAEAVFDVYRDWTPAAGIRSSEQEQVFKARLDELMGSIPEAAQPYAAAVQRLVVPTVRRPGQEWYETPQQMRTAPTNWAVAGGYKFNPAWR